MSKLTKVTPIADSARGDIGERMATEIRLLRIVAMPVTLLWNMGKGLWFLLCATADALWEDAFGRDSNG